MLNGKYMELLSNICLTSRSHVLTSYLGYKLFRHSIRDRIAQKHGSHQCVHSQKLYRISVLLEY